MVSTPLFPEQSIAGKVEDTELCLAKDQTAKEDSGGRAAGELRGIKILSFEGDRVEQFTKHCITSDCSGGYYRCKSALHTVKCVC